MPLKIAIMIVCLFCVFAPGCSCRKKPEHQTPSLRPARLTETVHGVSISQDQSETAQQPNALEVSGAESPVPLGGKSLRQLAQQLSQAESKFRNGDSAVAYREAMQVWQACRDTGSSADSPVGLTTEERSELREQAEQLMQSISAQRPGSRISDDKPLTITGW